MSTGTEAYDGQLVAWDEYDTPGDDVRCEYIDGRMLDGYALTPDGVYRRTTRIADGEIRRLELGIATAEIDFGALLR